MGRAPPSESATRPSRVDGGIGGGVGLACMSWLRRGAMLSSPLTSLLLRAPPRVGSAPRPVAASLALSKKFSDACSGKVSVSSPLPVNGGVFNPVLSLYTTGDVAAKTTASLSVQVETSKKYKYGVQFATKL